MVSLCIVEFNLIKSYLPFITIRTLYLISLQSLLLSNQTYYLAGGLKQVNLDEAHLSVTNCSVYFYYCKKLSSMS